MALTGEDGAFPLETDGIPSILETVPEEIHAAGPGPEGADSGGAVSPGAVPVTGSGRHRGTGRGGRSWPPARTAGRGLPRGFRRGSDRFAELGDSSGIPGAAADRRRGEPDFFL